jgi:UDP-glucose 4-epimerase
VTGASGYIASHMCYELRQAYPNCFIVGVDKKMKQKLRHLYDEFLIYDLARTNSMIFDKHKADCVFHFAALASVPEGESIPYTYYQNNLMSSMKILDEAIFFGVKNFVFSSSCSVYGVPDYLPVDEDHAKRPISVYAKTKSVFEDILHAAEKEHGIHAGVLRYFNAAGRNVEAGLYEEHDPETHLIPNLMKSENAIIYGDGHAVRDYIHVIDLCKAHISAYEYMEKNDSGIVCNLGTGKGMSVLDVISSIDKKFNIEYREARLGDLPELYANTNKMRNELTFECQHDILSIVQSMK